MKSTFRNIYCNVSEGEPGRPWSTGNGVRAFPALREIPEYVPEAVQAEAKDSPTVLPGRVPVLCRWLSPWVKVGIYIGNGIYRQE